jgi:hypothetical protein
MTARKPGPLEYVKYSLNGLSPYQERKAAAETGCISVVLVQVRSWILKIQEEFSDLVPFGISLREGLHHGPNNYKDAEP